MRWHRCAAPFLFVVSLVMGCELGFEPSPIEPSDIADQDAADTAPDTRDVSDDTGAGTDTGPMDTVDDLPREDTADDAVDLTDTAVDTGICLTGLTRCGDQCQNLENDADHCGACGNACRAAPNVVSASCANAECSVDSCADGFVDADGAADTGCEVQLIAGRQNTGLVAQWMFSEGAGLTAYDSSGIDPGDDLEWRGISDASSYWLSERNGVRWPGEMGSAVVTLERSPPQKLFDQLTASNNVSGLTVELFVNANDAPNDPQLIVRFGTATTVNFALYQSGDALPVYLRTDSGQTGQDGSIAGEPVVRGSGAEAFGRTGDLHLVLTHDIGTATTTLYVNGDVVDTETLEGGFTNWSVEPLSFFKTTDSTEGWRGNIYFAAVYSRALTLDEIRLHEDLGPMP